MGDGLGMNQSLLQPVLSGLADSEAKVQEEVLECLSMPHGELLFPLSPLARLLNPPPPKKKLEKERGRGKKKVIERELGKSRREKYMNEASRAPGSSSTLFLPANLIFCSPNLMSLIPTRRPSGSHRSGEWR
jgi:hypothetical protein